MHTHTCVPACVCVLQFERKRNRLSFLREGTHGKCGNTGSCLSAAALGFKILEWGSQLFRLPTASSCWVCEDLVICHSSEMPLTHHHPALVSTIVLAKVTPFPTSLDFWKSSQFAFYWSLWELALPFHVYKALPPWHSWLIHTGGHLTQTGKIFFFLTGIMKSEKVAREAIF